VKRGFAAQLFWCRDYDFWRSPALEAVHMRIVWVSLIIVAFGVGMFWLRRYMER
jgi:hypothetical protein